MKRLLFLIAMIGVMFICSNALAGFSIPIDISNPDKFDPSDRVGNSGERDVCDESLESKP